MRAFALRNSAVTCSHATKGGGSSSSTEGQHTCMLYEITSQRSLRNSSNTSPIVHANYRQSYFTPQDAANRVKLSHGHDRLIADQATLSKQKILLGVSQSTCLFKVSCCCQCFDSVRCCKEALEPPQQELHTAYSLSLACPLKDGTKNIASTRLNLDKQGGVGVWLGGRGKQ